MGVALVILPLVADVHPEGEEAEKEKKLRLVRPHHASWKKSDLQ